MPYESILERIKSIIAPAYDGHYDAIHRAFQEGDLTAPSLSISDISLSRAISEFLAFPPNEASIETLERRLNPKY